MHLTQSSINHNNHEFSLFNINSIDWDWILVEHLNMSKYSSSVTNLRNFIPNKSPITTTTSALLTTISPLPLHESVPIVLILSTIVVLCVCGNILVILSIFTFRPLRTVQKIYIISLAVSDMLITIIVMTFHIVKHILNRWIFGR